MSYELSIPASSMTQFENRLATRLEEVKQPVQGAMAEKYFEIVRSNFGQFGVDRPIEWAPLSDRSEIGRAYIRKVGRTYATLFVTGKLESSVSFDANEDRGRVYVDNSVCDYAVENQYGNPARNLPPRPFFPLTENGETSEFTQEKVTEAARGELERLIGSSFL
jgi:phage gpG-like protein